MVILLKCPLKVTFRPRQNNGLLEYYLRQKRLEDFIKTAVEWAILLGEGYLVCKWDVTGGQEYGVNPETGTVEREGDMIFYNVNPINMVRDFTKQSWSDNEWVITVTYANRFNEAAKYPEWKDKILSLPSITQEYKDFQFLPNTYFDTDDIPVYHFYHKDTAACPGGRYVKLFDDKIVVSASALPFHEIPVYRIVPEEMQGSPFGYSISMDLLPVQESLDMLYSTVLTNQSSFGVQTVVAPKGSGVTRTQLGSGGMNLIEYDKAPPQPLNLTSTPKEIFDFMQMLEGLAETISGINSVARGTPNENLKSGAALALVQSMAIQFSMTLQQNYAQLLESVGTAMVNLLKDFVDVPRIAEISGKANRPMMKEFKGDDLKYINRVIVDMGNPVTQTTAGRVNLAESLMQNKLIDTADQYIMVLETGRLEPIIEGKQAELLLIRAENEDMAAGKPSVAIVTDMHALHIFEHKAVLADPDTRRDPKIVTAVTAHMQEHINFLKNADPVLLQLIHQQPVPPTPPQNAGGIPAQQPVSPVAELANQNPVLAAAQKARMPQAPINPMTHERAPLPKVGAK